MLTFDERLASRLLKIVTSLMAAFILVMTVTNATAKSSDIPVCAQAKIVGVRAWAFNAPDPKTPSEKVDVFSVKARNASNSGCVVFPLIAYSHGRLSTPPFIMAASEGLGEGAKTLLSWVVVERTGVTKTVFFAARSVGADAYCVSGTM